MEYNPRVIMTGVTLLKPKVSTAAPFIIFIKGFTIPLTLSLTLY